MAVEYSPLCNTDKSAYFLYLAGILFQHGASFDETVRLCGTVGNARHCGSGGSIGESAQLAIDFSVIEREKGLPNGSLCAGVVGSVDSGGCFSKVDGREHGSVGLASSYVDNNGGCYVGGDGNEFSRSCSANSDRLPVEQSGSSVKVEVRNRVSTGSVSGGLKKKKMGKNQKDRAKARLAATVGGDDWRKPVVEKVGKVEAVVPVVVEKSEARLSLEEKWVVENRVSIAKAKLAEEKAKKDLEFQRARDVDAEVRKSRARIMRETESSKVATEKAFASLKASGNVPGFCATVVSDGPGLTDGSSPECTISPDSSASMQEFRAAQKEVLDLKKENADLVRQLRLGKLMLGEEVTFTAKSDGDASEELTKALDALENDHFYVDRSEDPACFGVNKTIYAKRMYIDTHSYDGDY